MLLELETFTIETALDAATELRKVLAARTHRRKVMGQEVMVPGQLARISHSAPTTFADQAW